jgi:hypothetical protein
MKSIIYHPAANLAGLPSPRELEQRRSNEWQVTLRVMVLSLYLDEQWNSRKRPAIMLVTDFTANNDLLYPPGAPTTFTFDGALDQLDANRVFGVSVDRNAFDAVAQRLENAIDDSGYDFTKFHMCLIDKERVMATVTCKLKTYRNKIESWLVGDSLQLAPEAKDADIFQRFDRLSSDAGRRNEPKVRKPSVKRSPSSPIPPSPSPPPAQPPATERPRNSSIIRNLDNLNKRVRFDAQQAPQPLLHVSQSPVTDTLDGFSQAYKCLHESDDLFSQPLQLSQRGALQSPPLELELVEVEVLIREFFPQQFIVKPYARTLKIMPFKVLTWDASQDNLLELEFITETEICSFLELTEIEEALEAIPIIVDQMHNLEQSAKSGRRSLVKIQKRVQAFSSTKTERHYWTCVTPLSKLEREAGETAR